MSPNRCPFPSTIGLALSQPSVDDNTQVFVGLIQIPLAEWMANPKRDFILLMVTDKEANELCWEIAGEILLNFTPTALEAQVIANGAFSCRGMQISLQTNGQKVVQLHQNADWETKSMPLIPKWEAPGQSLIIEVTMASQGFLPSVCPKTN